MSDEKMGAVALSDDYATALLGERREALLELRTQLQEAVDEANTILQGNVLTPLVIDKHMEEHAGGPDEEARLRMDEGGTVWLESKRIKGTTGPEALPPARPPAPAAPPQAPAPVAAPPPRRVVPPPPDDGPLPKMNELRPMAAELGLDISHLGRQRRAIWALIRQKQAEVVAEGVDQASKALKETPKPKAKVKPKPKPEPKPESETPKQPKKKMVKTGDAVPVTPVLPGGDGIGVDDLDDLFDEKGDNGADLGKLQEIAKRGGVDPDNLPKDKDTDLSDVTPPNKETDLSDVVPDDKETDLSDVVGDDEDIEDILNHNA